MKNAINILALLVLFVCISASSCDDKKELNIHIYVKNNSSTTIYYGLSYSYPDTSLIKIGQIPGNNGSLTHKIISGEQGTLAATNFAFNPTMQMFIFDADVVEKEPWDSIVAHYKVLKRYQFTESDMQNVNWIITYP